MAHFAKLDGNNVVIDVVVVDNSVLQDLPFPESEALGVSFLNGCLGEANWKQTSYNHNFRANYAGKGYTFRPEWGEHGGFAPPTPQEGFVWNEATCNWVPPIPYPTDGYKYYWDFYYKKWVAELVTAPPIVNIG